MQEIEISRSASVNYLYSELCKYYGIFSIMRTINIYDQFKEIERNMKDQLNDDLFYNYKVATDV